MFLILQKYVFELIVCYFSYAYFRIEYIVAHVILIIQSIYWSNIYILIMLIIFPLEYSSSFLDLFLHRDPQTFHNNKRRIESLGSVSQSAIRIHATLSFALQERHASPRPTQLTKRHHTQKVLVVYPTPLKSHAVYAHRRRQQAPQRMS